MANQDARWAFGWYPLDWSFAQAEAANWPWPPKSEQFNEDSEPKLAGFEIHCSLPSSDLV